MSRRQRAVHLGLPDPGADDAQRVLLFRLVLATAHELRIRMDRLLAESGLTTQQAMVMQFLTAEPDPPTLTEFARQLAMSHQNLKQIASALERKGMLEMVPDASDGRVRRLKLTARFRRFWAQRDPDDHAEVVRWTAPLSTKDVRKMVSSLDTLHASLIGDRRAGS